MWGDGERHCPRYDQTEFLPRDFPNLKGPESYKWQSYWAKLVEVELGLTSMRIGSCWGEWEAIHRHKYNPSFLWFLALEKLLSQAVHWDEAA